MLTISCYKHTKKFREWKRGESRNVFLETWRNKGHLRQIQLYKAFEYMCFNVWCIQRCEPSVWEKNMNKEIQKFTLENVFGEKRVIEGYITDIEDDCIHIKTVDGENVCISR